MRVRKIEGRCLEVSLDAYIIAMGPLVEVPVQQRNEQTLT